MSKNETLADVLAEMRRGTRLPGYWRSCDVNKILMYHADRIEAEHKREVDKLNSVIQAQRSAFDAEQDRWSRKHPGNAAKLREAVEALIPVAEHGLSARTHSLNCTVGVTNVKAARALVEQAKEAITNARAALAAPARNCDKYTGENINQDVAGAYVGADAAKMLDYEQAEKSIRWLLSTPAQVEEYKKHPNEDDAKTTAAVFKFWNKGSEAGE